MAKKVNVILTIELPLEALDQVATGIQWNGKVKLSAQPTTSKRGVLLRQGSRLAKQNQQRQSHMISDEVTELINFWNDTTLVQTAEQQNEERNRAVTLKLSSTQIGRLKRTIARYSLLELQRLIKRYCQACQAGGHLFANRNNAYKNLHGLINKLVMASRKKDTASIWWMSTEETSLVTDTHPKLTAAIMQKFAKAILGRRQYPVSLYTRDYSHFAKASAVLSLYKKTYRLTQVALVEYFIGCVQEQQESFENRTIHAGYIGSDRFCKLVLPQYLKGLFR